MQKLYNTPLINNGLLVELLNPLRSFTNVLYKSLARNHAEE